MSYRIRLLPTEHEFSAEAHETVLEAALRSGLNLSYNCNSGSCGDCMARITSGDYEVVNHFDYQFSEAEKLQNKALLCCIGARSDMVIEAVEALGVQDIPHQEISVKVAKMERIGEDFMVLHMRTPRSKTLRFLAGQYIHVQTQSGLGKHLAIASCPCNGMILQCHLYRGEGDAFTDYVFNTMQPSAALSVDGPYGDFTLDENSQRSVVMVAQDTGFAPIKSLIEHAISLDRPQAMHLFWIGANDEAHYQANYCRAWEDAFDVFVYTPLIMGVNPEPAQMQEIAQQISARSPIESELDLYLSCTQQVNAALQATFTQRGTPASRIFTARF
jgi:CDP-4-dehydro-6-deoxyglucose reductase